ncbi:MAG: HlyD family efflux transporter periplasmic adaptor subunit [Clostridia bacterium]|nr:HlyD family efflux transporter periplasmic adaptor subunit [Clostridia bacterium]
MSNTTDRADRITQRQEKEKRRKKKKWIVKGIAAAIIVYLMLAVIFSFYSSMSTTIAMKGSVEENELVNGYVLRKQQVIMAPIAGYLECRVNEGERVKEGQIIGYIYTGEYDAERSGRIRQLSQQIAELEGEGPTNTYAANGVMVEQKIASAARNYSDLRQNRNMSELAKQKEELNQLIERKHTMNSGGVVDRAQQLQALKQELYDLEISTGGSKHAIVAPSAGVFTSKIDGMEDDLIYENAEKLTPTHLKELDRIEPERKETVVAGEPVCKIVDNYGWYFVASVDAKKAESLTVGKTVEMHFFDLSDATISGTIKSVSQEEKGEVSIAIYTNRYVEGIYSSSRASAELVTMYVEGIKLPVQSIHVIDGQTGVYVIRLDVARFVPVSIRYKNDRWAIVSAVQNLNSEYRLQIYDEVIVEGKNLESGKVVR